MGGQSSADGETVLLTGVGLHSGLGDTAATWRGLAGGRSALSLVRLPGVDGFPEVPGATSAVADDLTPFLSDRKIAKYMSPATRLAVLAAGRALEDAGLLGEAAAGARASLGLFVAAGLIALDLDAVAASIEAARTPDARLDLSRLGSEGLRRCHPLLPFKLLLNMPVGLISIIFGIRGANFMLYPGASQGAVALEAAWRAIRAGRLERALVGGTCQGLSLLPLGTLGRLGRLAPSLAAALPFGPRHAGWAVADAAAFVVLESARSAGRRGAREAVVLRSLAQSRSPGSGREGRTTGRATVWERAAGSRPPDLLLSTGTLDWAEDQLELRLLDDLWPGAAPRLSSLDGSLGQPGAASLPLALALGARMVERGEALPAARPAGDGAPPARLLLDTGGGAPRRLLVTASDPDGGCSAVLVTGREGPS